MLRAAPVIEAMRWEHASNAKKWLLVSMAELIEDINIRSIITYAGDNIHADR